MLCEMTAMMDGSVSVDPQKGKETVIEGFDNVWQIFGAVSDMDANAGGGYDIISMCNINMLYFSIAALVCIFVAEDFRSGYAKNLFTVRTKKTDYVASKTLVLTFGAAMMIPMLTPLNATALNVLLCAAGSVGFGIVLRSISKLILKKQALYK